MSKKKRPTRRDQVNEWKESLSTMTADELAGLRDSYWPAGSGVLLPLVPALIEKVAEERGFELPPSRFETGELK